MSITLSGVFFQCQALRIRQTLHMVYVSPAVFIASACRVVRPQVIHLGHEALLLFGVSQLPHTYMLESTRSSGHMLFRREIYTQYRVLS